jgi:type II restriction/modification system DNA methylase subunit YeeA
MNTNKIKSYAIQASRDFLKAVTERANFYGIFGDNHIEEMTFKGDVAIIGDRPIPKKEGELRQHLVERIKQNGFGMTLQADAYSWFNRFAALRYMELHGYLDHGFRVLSHPSGSSIPEIFEQAVDIDLQGLNKNKVIELRLAGSKDNELYRLLIIAQCNALHSAMPFLFDKIDSETELLLPENLLHSDSLIRKLVSDIPEDEWLEVEIIGWLYQFYISEKKDEVIGKVVKSEDIPAATQLFTPNWIVKYMVQNTLGRMWLATYPDSPLRAKMEYYIAPALQEPDVQKQLDAVTPRELYPETITFFDPAQGSGHILVEAYNVFKEIYLERGYRTRDIPRLILEKNLYGLDICDRAAQLAGFALMMKARADDRKILGYTDLRLNVYAIQDSRSSDLRSIEMFFKGDEFQGRDDLKALAGLFENAKTFGSLITVPEPLAGRMQEIVQTVEEKIGKWRAASDVQNIRAIVNQAELMARKYDCVVTNPPYMGGKGMNGLIKTFLKDNFPDVKSDLFSAFIVRNTHLTKPNGRLGFMSPFVWMFISSYEKLRSFLIDHKTITSLIQLEYSGFDGATVPICTFTVENAPSPNFKGGYIRLSDFRGAENQAPKTLEAIQNPACGWFFHASAANFKKIPGSPIAYWVSEKVINAFVTHRQIYECSISEGQNITADNDKYLRVCWEVNRVKVEPAGKWSFYSKGGAYRKWFGNLDYVVDWSEAARKNYHSHPSARIIPKYLRFREGITWTLITSSKQSFRFLPNYATFDKGGSSIFFNEIIELKKCLLFLNTKISAYLTRLFNATLNLQVDDVRKLPLSPSLIGFDDSIYNGLIDISKSDWDSYESSWGFSRLPLLHPDHHQPTMKSIYKKVRAHWRTMTLEMQRLEEENNRIFIDAYDLQDELTPEVPLSEITLTCNPHYRYSGSKTEEELETQLLTDTIEELISYSIGCMMGRYSLDEPGLIYAHSGNIGFEPSKYKTFPADDDGIIPIIDTPWFPDDAANRFVEFLKVVWPPKTLAENLKFVADSLNLKRNEDPTGTIRKYLSVGFFKDHLKTYKKRPIYWLFSSGKLKAFECLVYLHRYNESTLSRMRSLYVTPLQGNIRSRIEFLDNEQKAATSASGQRKFQKEIEMLKKKQTELAKFDDELRHYADMRISLDLDDGVKVNYSKFGNLLTEVKAITGE